MADKEASETDSVGRRSFVAATAGAAMVGLAGCSNNSDGGNGGDGGDGDSDLSVSITNLEDGQDVAGSVTVQMDSNATIEESGEVNDGAGHFHLIVDAPTVETGEVVPSNGRYYHYGGGGSEATLNLPPGEHEITCQLANGAHEAYDATDSVTVNVTEAPDTPVAYFTKPEPYITENAPSDFEFEFSASGVEVMTPNGDDSGAHFHIVKDAAPVPEGETIPSDDNHIHYGDASTSATLELSEGDHTLHLMLGDDTHARIGAYDTVTVSV
jgi:hypothetical protein